MLDAMPAHLLTEWQAFYRVKEEDRKREELAAKAEHALEHWGRRARAG